MTFDNCTEFFSIFPNVWRFLLWFPMIFLWFMLSLVIIGVVKKRLIKKRDRLTARVKELERVEEAKKTFKVGNDNNKTFTV